MKSVIITGATSLLGTSLVRAFTKDEITVYAIVRPNSPNMQELQKSKFVKIIECDLADISKISQLIDEKCDTFFHLGWCGTARQERGNFDIQHSNVKITLDAVRVAKQLHCEKFIGTGSQAEYGPSKGVLSPESPTNPVEPYGANKLAAYYCAKELAREIGIEFCWVRVFSVYGPADNKQTLITSMVKCLLKNEIPALTGCEQIWDYLYVDDAAQALKLVAEKGVNGRVYCLGSGNAVVLKNYVAMIYKACGSNTEPVFGKIAYGENQVMHLEADISALQKDVGFKPVHDFESGIIKTIKWIKEKEQEVL